jgi:hypothetical protein
MKLTTTVALVRRCMEYTAGAHDGLVLRVPKSADDSAYLVPLVFGGDPSGAQLGPIDANVVDLIVKGGGSAVDRARGDLFKIPRTRDEHKVNLTCLADTFKFPADDAADFYVFLVA